MSEIETTLRKRIKESGVKQMDLAKAIGISQTAVSRFIREETGISVRNFEAISKYLGERETMQKAGLIRGKK